MVTVETDLLVIGAGMGGIMTAIKAHDLGVKNILLVTKGQLGKDSATTWMASFAFNAAVGPNDSVMQHVKDTIRAGWFLNNQKLVYTFLNEAPERIKELIRWGARYNMQDGKIITAWLPGHSIARGVHPEGEVPEGYVLSKILPRLVESRKITVVEDTFVTDLLAIGDAVVGAVGIDIRSGRFRVFKAKSTVLATGGFMACFNNNRQPAAFGDGHAMALRAGVDMMDMEFIQFITDFAYPTSLIGTGAYYLCARGGAWLINNIGERFMPKYASIRAERSTRSVLTRAITAEIAAGRGFSHGGVLASLRHLPRNYIEQVIERNSKSNWMIRILDAGIDLVNDGVEIASSAHSVSGGCCVNERCETNLKGLYAVGEVASGKDGADRLAGQALPFAASMGAVAGKETAKRATMKMPEIDDKQIEKLHERIFSPLNSQGRVSVFEPRRRLLDLNSKYLTCGRTKEGLELLLTEIRKIRQEVLPNLSTSNKSLTFNLEWVSCLEFMNMVDVAEMAAGNALRRTETRGLHDRYDYPETDANWLRNIHMKLVDGKIDRWTTPVEFPLLPLEGTGKLDEIA